MPLTIGSRIGHFEVESLLGAGGMGEVYRARDSRLDRSVAIKSLPEGFARDPERLARLEREAKLLASLNHPHIAGIHGLEDAGGGPCLVLEFVEGETLAQRIARGPLGARETLEIGGQIASAIEAAHERGIVHRDLKPGNVMLTATRGVKVLDFGLAKGDRQGGAGATAELSHSPTVALSATGAGLILGTAPYMSPEQARGLAVDRRTDVWAFGCVLFECLSGRQVFAGETVSDVIARILEREPDWSALPPSTPPRLRDLVRRCLTKDAAERPRDIGDLRRELGALALELSAPGVAAGVPSTRALPSLAVLYFENLAQDPESEYFCAGITEDILTDLSKIKGLRVASRNAVARYRGAPADIPRVAAELGVGAVLEGSVRRAGERVRITAQLINARDGFHLWAERYDRTLQDVFAVQEEIASSIAAALRVALTPAESQNLVQDRPGDVRAYDLYLKGREHYGRYSAADLRRALALFQEATTIDPGYALAWAGIADCYGQMNQWGGGEPGWNLAQLGLEAADRAIALNPKLPDAYKAKALVLRFAGDRDAAREALMRAVEIQPRFLPAVINLAVDAFSIADLARAERLLRRAIEVDPQELFATGWLSVVLKLTGRGDEANATSLRMAELATEPLYLRWSRMGRAWVHLERGELEVVERILGEAADDGPSQADFRSAEAALRIRQGRIDEARVLVRGLGSGEETGAIGRVLLAGTLLRLGETEAARRLMKTALVDDLGPNLLRLEPDLHPLLDAAPFAPRRSSLGLVWPLEAPMIDAACHALFKEVRIESGRPQGSDAFQP